MLCNLGTDLDDAGARLDAVHESMQHAKDSLAGLNQLQATAVSALIDGDGGKSLGRIILHELAPHADVIAIDGVQLKAFDYVDIGSVIELTNVVPIIIKSLLFK